MQSLSRKYHSSPKFFLASTGLTIFLSLTLILFALLNSLPSQANTEIIANENIINDLSEVGQGTLLFKQEDHYHIAPQLNINVAMKISGMINRVSVKQHFTNTTDNWQEGIYVFPLPEDAAVDHMRLKIGERIIEGQIKEKKQAKRIYQKAKKQGKQAALTEQERPNIFTTSVANIAPGESVTVEIEYQQIVRYDNGTFSLRFPMVVGPRYIPGKQDVEGFAGTGWALNTDEVPDAARITPPVMQPGNNRKNLVSINIDLDAGLQIDNIDSPYHPIQINKQGQYYQITLQQGKTLANRDFELIWQPHPSVAPKAALFNEQKDGKRYAMIMMVPPELKQAKKLKREIIYVIDTSGSMGGQSIIQARAALELALSRLKPGDRFNVIQFNSFTSSLFKQPQDVGLETLTQAINYVRSLNAGGGTEMATALLTALANQNEDDRLRQVIFLTDGSIGNEQALFEIIKEKLGKSRLFTIGIGSAPNSHFMQRAASFGRGTHTYIGKLDEVQVRMQTLFKKIESPVLKDIRIDWNQSEKLESWPQKIGDLYQGEPLLITARADQFPNQIEVIGNINGKEWTSTLQLNGGQRHEGVSTLWARKKIAALMEQKRDAEFESIKKIIIETALTHHIVSKFTSLVAVDVTPVRPVNEKLDSRAIPTHLPKDWDYQKVFGQPFPATATDARLNLLIGLFLILLSLMTYLTHRKNEYV